MGGACYLLLGGEVGMSPLQGIGSCRFSAREPAEGRRTNSAAVPDRTTRVSIVLSDDTRHVKQGTATRRVCG